MAKCRLTNRELVQGEPIVELKLYNQAGPAPIVSLHGLQALFGQLVEANAQIDALKDRVQQLEAVLTEPQIKVATARAS